MYGPDPENLTLSRRVIPSTIQALQSKTPPKGGVFHEWLVGDTWIEHVTPAV